MTTLVVGTAGHIDHGKTTLLRALTGIDADRLPEERRRGMTIDVGYAHAELPDGLVLDFVDVPGHERLVGNMLVGVGEVEAALLVVAADDGPRAQTLEHLELLDALHVIDGVVAMTKVDVVDETRVDEVAQAVEAILAKTALRGLPIVPVSSATGAGMERLRAALEALGRRVAARRARGPDGGARLAVDRVFRVRGRGVVVTGTLDGGPVERGDRLRVVPSLEPPRGGAPGPDVRVREVRVREVQVHGATVPEAGHGRTALLLGGAEAGDLRRGLVLTTDDAVVASSRLLVALRPPPALRPRAQGSSIPADRARLRLHHGTDQVEALVIRSARESLGLPDGSATAIIRLARDVAVAPGDRFALRDPAGATTSAGGVVVDCRPPRGISRRRATPTRLDALVAASSPPVEPATHAAARLELHGALETRGKVLLAADVAGAAGEDALRRVADHHAQDGASAGVPLGELVAALAAEIRRSVTLPRTAAMAAAGDVLDATMAAGRLVRDADRVREPGRAQLSAEVRAAMDRLEQSLTSATPPSLALAASEAGCPPDGVRALEAERRIVRLEDDLAWSAVTYRELAGTALRLAANGPLTPAALRDATGSSRRYVLVILEDLNRRQLLVRTPDGHRLGPRALEKSRTAPPTAGRAAVPTR